MDDFLELGLEMGDKLIDKGFDKLPDRIVSPLGAEIHNPIHRRKKENELQKANPKRSATMPVADGRRRGRDRDDRWSDSDDGYDRDREHSPPRRREPPYPESKNAVDIYEPNPRYDRRRPGMVSRRSQSYAPPRRRRSPSYDSTSSRSPSPSRKQKVLQNPVATGTIGAIAGGLLANQAARARAKQEGAALSGKKNGSRRSKSSRRAAIESDETLLTLTGVLVGGAAGALAGDLWKHRKQRRAKEHKEWEADVARNDYERENHDAEAWAQEQDYKAQLREARRWQAQVDAGQRERERRGRDDFVVVDDGWRDDGRGGRIRQEVTIRPVYEDRWHEPERGDRRERRRSFDDGYRERQYYRAR